MSEDSNSHYTYIVCLAATITNDMYNHRNNFILRGSKLAHFLLPAGNAKCLKLVALQSLALLTRDFQAKES